MLKLSPTGQQAISDLAQRHGFSREAVTSMLESVANGHGTMAQFNHAEFGGSGQWMRGGMTMVSDMFNDSLKGRVDELCSELSRLVADDPTLTRGGTFQSQSQSREPDAGEHDPSAYGRSARHQRQSAAGAAGPASLFVPQAPQAAREWWPADLGIPSSTGAQNDARYAYFGQAHRLAIETNGRVTVYDTLDHQIGGFSQQQSSGSSLSFHSQHGLLDVARLPVIPVDRTAEQPPAKPAVQHDSRSSGTSTDGKADALASLEKLGDLHAKGVLSDEEFAAKKAELLGRV